jgi:peptide/nickel transport system substrate-binding protein
LRGRRARRIEALRTAWPDACSIDEQRPICTDLQMQLWLEVAYIPVGTYWQSTAYRKDLLDVLLGCFAVFYSVRRG